jgi:hypothetical protein
MTNDRTLFVEGLVGTRGMAFQFTGSPSTNIVRSFVSRERNRNELVSETYRTGDDRSVILAARSTPKQMPVDAHG